MLKNTLLQKEELITVLKEGDQTECIALQKISAAEEKDMLIH